MSGARPRDLIQCWPEVVSRLSGKSLAFFLDFDGTLVELADHPSQVELSAERAGHIGRLIQRWPTTLLTGRALSDITRRVPLADLNYAANHGFEMLMRGMPSPFYPAPEVRAVIDDAAADLRPLLSDLRGVEIENKGYSVAVHYRRAPRQQDVVEAVVTDVVTRYPELRKTRGKMLFEVRPASTWDKGRAVRWVLDSLPAESVPVVIGDDETDEDAFAAIGQRGVTVRVGESASTNAAFSVESVTDVYFVLLTLMSLEGWRGRSS